MQPFLNWLMMGGYANYIWPAYGLFFSVLLFHFLNLRHQKRRTLKQLQQWFKRQHS